MNYGRLFQRLALQHHERTLKMADTNGNGILEQGEFLPDWNLDGAVAFSSGDNFDNRTAAEIAADSARAAAAANGSAGRSGVAGTDPAANAPGEAPPGASAAAPEPCDRKGFGGEPCAVPKRPCLSVHFRALRGSGFQCAPGPLHRRGRRRGIRTIDRQGTEQKR